VTIVPMARGAVLRLAPTAEALAHAAASEVLAVLEAAMAWRGEAHLALAGGRTPAALYRVLATLPFEGWSHLHVWFGDERDVPPEHADSNYRMARETLLSAVPIPDGQVHRMAGECAPASAASDYDLSLRALAGRQERPAPTFDLLLLGMGADAHTASLFPGSPLLEQGTGNREQGTGNRQPGTGNREPATGRSAGPPGNIDATIEGIGATFAAAVYAPAMERWRVTITPATIRAARTVFVLVAGADKHAALRRVLGESPALADAPVTLLHDVPGDVAWFVDRAALFGG
jgi:6-phosphogluconolactonase